MKKARYFTKFDVRWGYNNVRIREGDEHNICKSPLLRNGNHRSVTWGAFRNGGNVGTDRNKLLALFSLLLTVPLVPVAPCI